MNKIFFLIVFISNMCFAQFPTNGLVAQYGFDNGNLLADGANGVNFTKTGTSLVEVNDRFGNSPTSAVSLNGDYLTRADIPIQGSHTFSVTYSFWIKTSTNSTDVKTIIDDSTRNTLAGFDSDDVGYYISLAGGLINISSRYYEFQVYSTPLPRGYGHSHPLNIADNNWHHVIVEFNPIMTNGIIKITSKIYIDGIVHVNILNNVTGFTTSPNTTGNVTVGNSRFNHLQLANRYTDLIDDVLIYDRVLTPAEISSIGNHNSYCFTPLSSVLSATAVAQTTASINVPSTGTFDISYHKTSESFSNATIVTGITTGTTNLTGLDAFTDYKVYVRELCTGNTTSWSSPVNFKTARTIGRIYVNANATGNNNGISWTNAYTKLEDALATAQINEEIWIAQGTYKPHASDRTKTFEVLSENLKLYGGFNGTETQLSNRIFGSNNTILSGDLSGNDDNNISYSNATRTDNSYTVLTLQGENTLLDNLTITSGHANATSGNTETRYGGGIRKNGSSRNLTINNCKITKNIATEASGAFDAGYTAIGGTGSLIISNCEFTENLSAIGGAIYSANTGTSTVTYSIYNTLFSKNKTTDTNAGATGYGGSSMWLRSYGTGATIVSNITNCTFVDNIDTGTNAVMNNFNRTTLALTKNTNSNHTATISNCIFWNNKTINGVTARPIGGFIESVIPMATITNSIDQVNFTGITLSGTSANNTSTNPLFVDLAAGDYKLSLGSPAIDSGNNATVVGTKDLLGNQRIHNTTVDRGVYEFNSTTLGIDYFNSLKAFEVYPNPASSVVNVKLNEGIKWIEIYSLDGKRLITSVEKNINIADLPSGIYLIKVTDNRDKIGIKKFMKK